MTVPQRTQIPASPALAALFATDDAMPTAWRSVAVYTLGGHTVVLLDSPEAWSAWVVALQERHDAGPVAAQAGLHVLTAEGCVCGCPVMLVTGDLAERVAA